VCVYIYIYIYIHIYICMYVYVCVLLFYLPRIVSMDPLNLPLSRLDSLLWLSALDSLERFFKVFEAAPASPSHQSAPVLLFLTKM